MDVKVFEFPTANDNTSKIEKKFCELYNKKREGQPLDEVERDWLDTANTWLDAR